MLLPKSKKYQRNKLLNVLIYFHEVEKCSFPYFYTHLILFPKMENIVAIHFFARNTKNYLYIFIIIMYIYIYIIIYIFIYIYIYMYIYIYIYIYIFVSYFKSFRLIYSSRFLISSILFLVSQVLSYFLEKVLPLILIFDFLLVSKLLNLHLALFVDLMSFLFVFQMIY